MAETDDDGVVIQGDIDQLIRDIESGKCAERWDDRVKAIQHFMKHEILAESDNESSLRIRVFGTWECR